MTPDPISDVPAAPWGPELGLAVDTPSAAVGAPLAHFESNRFPDQIRRQPRGLCPLRTIPFKCPNAITPGTRLQAASPNLPMSTGPSWVPAACLARAESPYHHAWCLPAAQPLSLATSQGTDPRRPAGPTATVPGEPHSEVGTQAETCGRLPAGARKAILSSLLPTALEASPSPDPDSVGNPRRAGNPLHPQ